MEEQNNSTSVCTEQCHVNSDKPPRCSDYIYSSSLPYMVTCLRQKGKVTAELLNSKSATIDRSKAILRVNTNRHKDHVRYKLIEQMALCLRPLSGLTFIQDMYNILSYEDRVS